MSIPDSGSVPVQSENRVDSNQQLIITIIMEHMIKCITKTANLLLLTADLVLFVFTGNNRSIKKNQELDENVRGQAREKFGLAVKNHCENHLWGYKENPNGITILTT